MPTRIDASDPINDLRINFRPISFFILSIQRYAVKFVKFVPIGNNINIVINIVEILVRNEDETMTRRWNNYEIGSWKLFDRERTQPACLLNFMFRV